MAQGHHSGSNLSSSLLFDCAQQKSAHTYIYLWLDVSLLCCCISLSSGWGGVMERRLVPSYKKLGKKKGALLISLS